jgi:hypothetical protein
MILRPIIFQKKKKKHIHQVVYASLVRKMLMVLLACEVDLLFNIVEKGCSCTLE